MKEAQAEGFAVGEAIGKECGYSLGYSEGLNIGRNEGSLLERKFIRDRLIFELDLSPEEADRIVNTD